MKRILNNCAYILGNYNAGLVAEPQPDIDGVHGGFSGTAESVLGVLEKSQEYHKYNADYIKALEFTHSGILQSEPYNAAKILSEYTHKNKELKIVWGHSMGADAGAIAYGNGLTYYNSFDTGLSRPELVQQIKQAKNREFFVNTFGKAERLHELNLVMPRVDRVLDNLDNMAKHADTVNIFMLREDERKNIKRYGDRQYETLINKLKDKNIPNNVNIIEINNFYGRGYHAGALAEDSPVLEQIFKQYKEIENKAGDQ